MSVCLSVCLLVSQERVGRLSPNIRGSSRAPQWWLGTNNMGVVGRGPENLHFLFPLHQCRPTWAYWEALAYSLGSVGTALATGWPRSWRRDTLLCLMEQSHTSWWGASCYIYIYSRHKCQALTWEPLVLTDLQYGQRVAWEIGTKWEVGMGLMQCSAGFFSCVWLYVGLCMF